MSALPDIITKDVQDRVLAPAAVASQVLLMSAISLITIVAFNFLRPSNKVIYEPKVRYHQGNKPPPKISDSIFGWVSPLVHVKEPELVDKVGLDAVAFLRFTRLLRWLFTSIALLTCAVLIPINVTQSIKATRNRPEQRNILSLLTIRDVRGNFLFVHVAVSYIITLFIIAFVNYHWKEMVRLRHQWFRSPEYIGSFYARTLAVMKVPKKFQSDQGIREIFQSVQVPYPTTAVHIGRRVGNLPELIEYHNNTVRQFEAILVRYLKGGKIAKERPTVRIGGFLGCGGVKKDAIEFYTAKLKRTEAAIEAYRDEIDQRKPENYGFASMAAVPYAHIVANLLRTKHPKGTNITLAPNPRDIIWANMNASEGTLARKRLIGLVWLIVVCFFNTFPLFIISILANFNALSAYVPIIRSWREASPLSFDILSGVLPPAVSGIFGFFLPLIMRRLSKYMGAQTRSYLDRTLIARYFAFLVVSQLVMFTLMGVVLIGIEQVVNQIGRHASFKEIVENLHTFPEFINKTYLDQSSFWLTFFPLRGFLVIFDLAQIINLVWISFKTRVFGRTPRDIREWTKPPDFQFAIYYSNLLFMAAVGLVFAPLAPLVVVAAALVFWIGSWVHKYQLMFVFTTKAETGGRIWNVVINRLLFCVILMQALMILTVGLQYGFRSLLWLISIPPILIVIAFKVYVNHAYNRHFQYFTPTDDEIRNAYVHSERADNSGNRLEKRFCHPALHMELFTPMLHSKMMPLLSEIYKGRINYEKAALNEYGGQKIDASLVPGGIRIAAIDQRDLEYDPQLYQRDRGELDWDQRSVATASVLMTDTDSIYPKSHMHSRMSTGPYPQQGYPPGYDQYLASGPGLAQNPADSTTDLHRPLLNDPSYNGQQQMRPPSRSRTPSGYNYSPSSIAQPPLPRNDGFREAPLHRPQLSGGRPLSSYEMSRLSQNVGPGGYADYFSSPGGGYRQ